jgi:hypothetical protein
LKFASPASPDFKEKCKKSDNTSIRRHVRTDPPVYHLLTRREVLLQLIEVNNLQG